MSVIEGLRTRIKSVFSKDSKDKKGKTDKNTKKDEKIEEKPVENKGIVYIDPKERWYHNDKVIKLILSFLLTGTASDLKDLMALSETCLFILDILEQPVYWNPILEDFKKTYEGEKPEDLTPKISPKDAYFAYMRKKKGIQGWKGKKRIPLKIVTVEDPQIYYPIPILSITYREDRDDAIVWYESNNKKQVESATLNKLIEELTSAERYDIYFCDTFLYTFRSFTERDTLIDKLIERYNIPPPKGMSKIQFMRWKTEKLDKVRIRIVKTVTSWIENFYTYDFDDEMNQKLDELLTMMKKVKNGAALAKTIENKLENAKGGSSGVIKGQQEKYPEVLQPQTGGGGLFGKKSKITNKLLIWPSLEIARQITLIDYEFFKSIQPKECLNNAWNKNNRDSKAPNIAKMINFFNTFSNWMATIILQTEDLEERIEILEKFIEVAGELYELNNYNGVFAVCSGLCLSSVFRLKGTWNGIQEVYKQKYQKLHRLISRDKNFNEIRTKIKNVKPPCIPYIGLYLTDLTFIEEGNQKYVHGKINFVKCQQFAEVIRDMKTYQAEKYNFLQEKSLYEMITTLTYLSEKEQQDLSLVVEPKEGKKGKK